MFYLSCPAVFLFLALVTLGNLQPAIASAAELSQRQQALRFLRGRAFKRNIRITSIAAYDQGSFAESSSADATLDTSQGSCSDSSDEPFFDTVLGIELVNNGMVPIRVKKIAYVVFAGNSDGSKFRARRFAPIGNNEVSPEDSDRVVALFLDTEAGRKYYAGASDPIDIDLGFRNVKVVVRGIDFNRNRFRVKRRVAYSFGNPDRCG